MTRDPYDRDREIDANDRSLVASFLDSTVGQVLLILGVAAVIIALIVTAASFFHFGVAVGDSTEQQSVATITYQGDQPSTTTAARESTATDSEDGSTFTYPMFSPSALCETVEGGCQLQYQIPSLGKAESVSVQISGVKTVTHSESVNFTHRDEIRSEIPVVERDHTILVTARYPNGSTVTIANGTIADLQNDSFVRRGPIAPHA